MKKPEYHSNKKKRISSNDYRSEASSEFLICEKDVEVKPKPKDKK